MLKVVFLMLSWTGLIRCFHQILMSATFVELHIILLEKSQNGKHFLDNKKLKKTFYYTDHISSLDFMTEDIKPPCIFVKNATTTELIMNSSELNKLISVDELIDRLNNLIDD